MSSGKMRPKLSPQLTVEHALLGFLQHMPLHGYELHQRIQDAQRLGLVWRVKQAHVYALLAKLEADGLVQAELIPQEARPPKRLLQLTAAGHTAFNTWLSAPVEHGRDVRVEFLAKLFWAQQAGVGATQKLLAAQRRVTRNLLANIESELRRAEDAQCYALLVNEFRRGQLEAMLRWLDTCEATLIQVPVEQNMQARLIG